MNYVLYNPSAGNGSGVEAIKALTSLVEGELKEMDITTVDYEQFFATLSKDDALILAGGDGTLNRFINDTKSAPPCEIYYFGAGSGNDFLHDIGGVKGEKPVNVSKYLDKNNLPTVTVNGRTCYFLNGIGYGIDGYCCEVGDEQRKTSTKPVNYTAIAIKGLLFHYKPTNAKITVDGVTKEYKKVWLAPTMNGRYYGGGMIPTPNQDRMGDGTLSTMVFHGSGKLKTLMIFPSIFKGEHVKHTKQIEILTGREITVEFDRPTALQIDGETILGVTSYTAKAKA